MWSNLQQTTLWYFAKQKYDSNGLSYHNWNHILELYAFLESEKVPYSQELDLAVLFHDIIYDELPEKEKRSADYMKSVCKGIFSDHIINESYNLIMATSGHKVRSEKDLWIIKADLAALRNPATATINFGKILEESRRLYLSLSDEKLIQGTHDFMKLFYGIMVDNLDETHDKFFDEILIGIEATINVSKNLLENSYGIYL